MTEQTDFELDAAANDRHNARTQGIVRGRERAAKADAKRFALRGVRGDFSKLHGDERRKAMVAAANAARVAKEVFKGKLPGGGRWMEAARVKRPKAAPTVVRKGRAKKTVLVTKPVSLVSIVARYKRTGDLPDCDVEFLREQDATGVDGAALRRIIQALLVRAGVETNPGPDDVCSNDGKKNIRGEFVRLKGRKVLICPKCPVHLTPKHGSVGDHPSCGLRLTAVRALTIVRPAGPRSDTVTVTTPIVHGTSSGDGPSSNVDEVPAEDGSVAGGGAGSESATEGSPPGDGGATGLPAVHTPGPDEEDNGLVDEVVLRGHILTDKDECALLGLACGFHIGLKRPSILDRIFYGTRACLDDIIRNDKVVKCENDTRIASNRNVVEIKQSMEVKELGIQTAPGCPMPKLFTTMVSVVPQCLNIVPGVAPFACWLSTWVSQRMYGLTENERRHSLASLAVGGVLGVALNWTNPVLAGVNLVATIAGLTAVTRMRAELPTVHYFSYVPHLVTCLASEFDRGCNETIVRATIRQKARRLASLPLHDEDHVLLVHCSELVAERLVSAGDFFGSRASVMRRL